MTTASRLAEAPRNRRVRAWVLPWLGIVAVAAGWQLVASLLHSPIVPTLVDAAQAAGKVLTGPTLTQDVLPSVERVLIGFAISAIAGVAIGVLLGCSPRLAEWCAYVVDFLRSLPVPLLIPVGIVIFGLGTSMVVAIIVSAAVWPVLLNTFDAIRRADPTMVESARSCGLRRFTLVRKVLLPAASPQIFAGLRVALSVGVAVMVVAEMLGGGSGIGYLIENAQQSFQVSTSYAGVVVLACLGWLMDTLFLAVERRVLSWQLGTVGDFSNV
jgi:sulfonate transport system permease protein